MAHSVADAMKAAAEPVDLLISDLGLPDGNGHDLMRQLSTGRDLKAIAVSGYGMEEDQQRSRDAGFSAHLVKPVSPAALRTAVAALLDVASESSAPPQLVKSASK